MFVVVSRHLFWWPVTLAVPSPDEPGRFVEATFEMQFEAMPLTRARAIDEARNALPPELRAARAYDFLHEIARDWRDVRAEDGTPVPFSPEAYAGQLDYAWFRDGILTAYEQALTGQAARLGNSAERRAD